MKAVYVIKSIGSRDLVQCETVESATHEGQRRALAMSNRGAQNVTLEIYELVATGNVQTTSTIKIEKAVKP